MNVGGVSVRPHDTGLSIIFYLTRISFPGRLLQIDATPDYLPSLEGGEASKLSIFDTIPEVPRHGCCGVAVRGTLYTFMHITSH